MDMEYVPGDKLLSEGLMVFETKELYIHLSNFALIF